MKYSCKITIGEMGQNYDSAIERLKKSDIEAIWDKGLKNSQDEKQIADHCKGFDFIIAGNEKWGATALKKCSPSLKFLVRYGIGYDSVDIQAASEHKIPVAILPGCNAESVAEQAVALMLDVQRKISWQDRSVREGSYEVQTFLTHNLFGKTIGLLGLGNIAKNVVRFLSGFHCNFIAYDVYRDQEFAERYSVKWGSFEEVISKSDIVSIHMPSNADTYHVINKKTLAMMKKTAILLNTARGGLVNTPDLIEALQNGVIAGAGLDVYEGENAGDNDIARLASLENIVLTKHTAAGTYETFEHMMNMAVEAIENFLNGKTINGLLNPDGMKGICGS